MLTITYFAQGLALGFGSGVMPGPMLALVLSTSLRGGFRNGATVAMSPLITDLPIIALSLTVLSQLPTGVLRAISYAGAAVLTWYAYEAARDALTVSLDELRGSAELAPGHVRSLRQGVIANFLNPSPWLFWMSVGGPLLTKAWATSPAHAIAFVLPFYALLIGSKVAVAWAAGAGRERLSNRGYQALLFGAAALLLVLAYSLVVNGVA